MSLTNMQAREILLELYAANLDKSHQLYGTLNGNRSQALWYACKVLKQTDETPTIYPPDTVNRKGKRAPERPSRTAEVPEGETGKAE